MILAFFSRVLEDSENFVKPWSYGIIAWF